MAELTRRGFAAVALTAAAARGLAQEKKAPITAASVPEDPEAPEVQEGTLPESMPFSGQIEFSRRVIPPKVEPFAMPEVRLLPGVFFDAKEANREFMLAQTADRLLHVFRLNAGLASTAEPLGGWEKPDCELRGHFVGHYLSACALMHASTGDKELRERGDYIVGELAKCQTKLPGGYLSAFPTGYFERLEARKKVWAPFYTMHKIMAGLLDMHRLCGNRQALQVLSRMTEWVDRYTGTMTEERMQMVLDTEYGGMNELFYNLAAETGDDHYARIGDRFTKKRFFNPLALRRDQLRGLHTNTHIPQVIGAARRYEISGDTRFQDVADYFWRDVVATRTYATGGTSNNEGWLVEPNRLAAELALGHDTNECCCAYNMLKLTRQLYGWSGDPRLFDYYERTLLNHRLGTINARGQTQYYLGIVPGSWRTYGTLYDSFWCCNGTGVEEYAKLNDSIYFHGANGIYVNLFVPSELNWTPKKFRLRQETRFPDEARSTLIVTSEAPTSLSIHVRVPAWVSSGAALKINGQPSPITAAPGSYVAITRVWKSGDKVEIELPMDLHYEAMPDDRNLRAILYGPLVLAGGLGNAGLSKDLELGPMGPSLSKHPAPPIPELRVVQPGDKPLQFEADGTGKVMLKPFYKLSGERYSIYWRFS